MFFCCCVVVLLFCCLFASICFIMELFLQSHTHVERTPSPRLNLILCGRLLLLDTTFQQRLHHQVSSIFALFSVVRQCFERSQLCESFQILNLWMDHPEYLRQQQDMSFRRLWKYQEKESFLQRHEESRTPCRRAYAVDLLQKCLLHHATRSLFESFTLLDKTRSRGPVCEYGTK